MVRIGYQRVCFARLHQLHQSPWQTYFTFQSNLALCLWNGNLLTSFQFIKRLKRSRQELSSYPSYKSACKDPGKTHIQSHFWFMNEIIYWVVISMAFVLATSVPLRWYTFSMNGPKHSINASLPMWYFWTVKRPSIQFLATVFYPN